MSSLTIAAFAMSTVLTPIPAMANSTSTSYTTQSTQSYANTITRLGGYDRHGTAVAVADYGWTSTTKAVLAPSGDLNMVDALASSSLAKAVDGPILLSNLDSVTPETLAELKKLGVTKVYIVSGTAVISTSVEAQLTAEGITSVRLGGYDRFETAVNIAKELQQIKPFTEVAIANGFASADAISIGAIAASKGIPILVVDRDTIPSTVSNFLATVEVEKSYVIGGTAVVSDAVKALLPKAERLAGLDRFDTNREVLKKFEDVIAGGKLFFANGADSSLVDALTGAPMAAKLGGAIVLANKNAVPSLTKTFVNTNLAIKNPGILGGTAVMSESTVKELCYADPTTDAVQTGAIGLGTVDATLEDVTVNGSVMLGADGQTLKNVIVNGTVFVDPGENGSATLENVKATKIVVLSGADESIHLIGTTANDLLVSSNSSNTHVVVEGESNLASVLVQSNGSLDVADEATVGPVVAQSRQGEQINVQLGGTFTNDVSVGGSVRLTAETGTTLPSVIVANETAEGSIELAGLFTQVSIADNSSVTLVSGRVAVMDAVESSKIIVNSGAEITTLTAPSGSTVSGGGDVNGTTTTETPVVVPPVVISPVHGGGGGTHDKANGPALTGVTSDDTDNTVTGITSAMEFSIDGETWTAYNSNLPDLTGAVALRVRFAETSTHKAGALTNFNFSSVPTSTSAVYLGTARNFAILAKTAVSSVPASVITGDVGVSPAAATFITGFSLTLANTFSTSYQVTGNVYAADYAVPTSSNLTTAVSDMETALTTAAGRAPNYTELYDGDISGKTLTTGVYKWGTGVLLNSNVTLSGGPNDVFIFQIDKGITQASGTSIFLSGGVQAKNIFWQASETVSIGTDAHFEGIVLCQTNIDMRTRSSINGRLLAQTAVTLDHSTVTAPSEALETEAKVNAAKSTVIVPIAAVTSGLTFEVSGVVKDANGTAIADKTVNVTFDRVTGTATTDSDGAYTVTLTPTRTVSSGYGTDGKVTVTVDGITISTDSSTGTVTDVLSGATQLVQGTGSTPDNKLDASLAPGTQYDIVTLVGSSENASSLNNAQSVGSVGAGNPLLTSLSGPYVTFTQGSTVKYAAIWVWAGDLGAKWVLYTVTVGTTVGVPQTSLISGNYTLGAVNALAITNASTLPTVTY